MFTAYLHSITVAMLQIFILGFLGFILVRKKVISSEGVDGLTRLLIEVIFPALIFWQIITKFSFQLYPNWWKFPLLSMGIIALGFGLGKVLSFSSNDPQVKKEFMSLVAFQNSGYLPLVLLGWIVPKDQLSTILIYLFLFLLGYNLVIWSWGVYFLSSHKSKVFSFASLFSPPVIATLLGFACVLTGINKVIPGFILSPLEMLGECSFPIAIIVVGATLADIYVRKHFDRVVIGKLLMAKLIFLPLAGLALVSLVRLPYLIGLLIVLELAMPSATTLTILARRYGKEEKIISQGVFLTHLLCLITLPLALVAFNWIVFRG